MTKHYNSPSNTRTYCTLVYMHKTLSTLAIHVYKVGIFLLLDKTLRVCVELITTEMRSQDHASVGTLIITMIYLNTFKCTN